MVILTDIPISKIPVLKCHFYETHSIKLDRAVRNMGRYDKEVSEKLGKDALQEIFKDAERDLINKQQMEDIEKGLGPPALSKHAVTIADDKQLS